MTKTCPAVRSATNKSFRLIIKGTNWQQMKCDTKATFPLLFLLSRPPGAIELTAYGLTINLSNLCAQKNREENKATINNNFFLLSFEDERSVSRRNETSTTTTTASVWLIPWATPRIRINWRSRADLIKSDLFFSSRRSSNEKFNST